MNTGDKRQEKESAPRESELQQAISQVLLQAHNHLEEGQVEAAESLFRAILEILPEHPEANFFLGILARKTNQARKALPYLRTAVTTDPNRENFWIEYVETLIDLEQYDAGHQTIDLGCKHSLRPQNADLLKTKLAEHKSSSAPADNKQPFAGVPQSKSSESIKVTAPSPVNNRKTPSRKDLNKLEGLQRKGNISAQEAFARDLINRYPEHGLGWKTLGFVLDRQGRTIEAIEPLQKAAVLLPADADTHNNLGAMLAKAARYQEAEQEFVKALEINSAYVAALCNFGNLLRTIGRLKESEQHLRKALEFERNASIFNNLGATLIEMDRIVDAEACFRDALKIQSNFSLACVNLGVCLRKQGRLEEAIEYQRRALKLDPHSTELLSHLLFTLNYTTGTTNLFHFEEALQYGRLVTKKVKDPFSSWLCSATPERLRLGFVSGDLYRHPVGFFLESIIQRLDINQVELFAYSTTIINDEVSERLKKHCSAWKSLCGLNDQAASRMIHNDGIHILYDLSGHTGNNRLPMFAWKPAPVQVSWLGYFATTGMKEIDFFLADNVGVPESQQKNFVETIYYLPDTRLCFSAPDFDLLVAPLPAEKNGYITFGCFQQLTKVSDEMLRRWKEILTALPDARLRWQCRQFGDPKVIISVSERLQKQGIDIRRVSLIGAVQRAQYLSFHAEIDLILDTFPYPGGTTTCEALWMGVPTLTLAGDSLLSRQGASLLSSAGLNDWIAETSEEYINKAINFARDIQALSRLRFKLRDQVRESPLFNADRFARNFEVAAWGMWEERQPPKRLLKNAVKEVVDDKPVMNYFCDVFWGTKDPKKFTNLMRQAAELTTAYHFGDNMFLFQRNNSMFNDQLFLKAWQENIMTDPDKTIIWRRYILAMAGFHCQQLEGDFVECGAYMGTGAKTVIDYLGGQNFKKTFWLYDMFEHNEKMVNHPMQHHGPQLFTQVINRFNGYKNVKILKGFLPDVLKQGCPEKIAYLHLDLNQAPAEIATLEALFDLVVPGGMIILDDYEMVFYRPQKLAEDVWFGNRGYKVFPLPTSQGFVIKR